MKTKKLLLTMVMVSFVTTMVKAQTWKCGANVMATLDNSGMLTVSGTGAMWDFVAATPTKDLPPWVLTTSAIKAVVIEAGVTTVGKQAFRYCNNMVSVSIPNSIEKIGDGAFVFCSSLKSVNIPNGYIDSQAFSESGLTSVTFGERVTYIGGWAFEGCKGLTNILIPDGVEMEISYGAFRDCDNLASVIISDRVTKIDGSAFEGTAWYNSQPDGVIYINRVLYKYKSEMPDNTSISIKDGTVSISSDAFRDCSGLVSVSIPNGVVDIGSGAFYLCNRLTSLNIPNSVTGIGDYAFRMCSNLTSVTLGNGLENIGKEAFYDCSKLTAISIPNKVKSIQKGTFHYCPELGVVDLPDNLQTIGEEAFYNCSKLTAISIPNSVREIGSMAFLMCRNLAAVNIPSGLTELHNGVFAYTALVSVIIPDGVKSVDAFESCAELVSVTIPASVTDIGFQAFKLCVKLTSVTNLNPTPQKLSYNNLTFLGIDVNNAVLHVPAGTKEAYQSATIWKNFITIIEDAPTTDINTIKRHHLTLSPNPATESVTISGLQGSETLYFYNVNGNLLFTSGVTGEREIVSVGHLPSGVYFVKVNNGQSLKWVKK